ncbi:MAG: glycosyltransferase [Bacteroidetes bacterium]|nr:MAG: glycosyltransferase [Bacteroidota bacterium]
MNPKLSVVIAVYNEALNVAPLVRQISEALSDLDYEIIFVDDGSSDQTIQNLKKIKHNNLKIIELRKNYGQSLALMAGIDMARGEYIATLDGDLQNDPSDIPMMLKIAEEGDWDLVAGIRQKRQDDMLFRKIPSKIANWIIRQTSGVKMKDYGCALKVFKSDIAKDLGLYGELHRFIPVLAILEGAKITQVPVKHHPRQFGQSKYGLGRTFKVISDLMLMIFLKKYMQKPMHLFGNWGIGLLAAGGLINFYLGFLKLQGQDIWGKPLLILGLMLVLGGIQLITAGIIVEIMMRTYFESQQKRPYKIRKIFDTSKNTNDS